MIPFVEAHKFVNVGNSSFIAANEDIFNGSPDTDIVNMKYWRDCIFTIQKGAGAAGTATVTVESCDTVVPGTATAVAFKYRAMTLATDTWSAWTDATSAGFTTTAGADDMYEIWVRADGLYSTDHYVRMALAEVDSTACDGGIQAVLFNPRYAEDVNPTVLT